jgi:hypothetical protein
MPTSSIRFFVWHRWNFSISSPRPRRFNRSLPVSEHCIDLPGNTRNPIETTRTLHLILRTPWPFNRAGRIRDLASETSMVSPELRGSMNTTTEWSPSRAGIFSRPAEPFSAGENPGPEMAEASAAGGRSPVSSQGSALDNLLTVGLVCISVFLYTGAC